MTDSMRALLLVEDNPGDVRLLRELLNEEPSFAPELVHAASLAEAETALTARGVDIILLDLGLPDAQGVDAVRRARALAPHTPVVVLTGLDDNVLAGQALQDGAQDYLIKGQFDTRGLLRSIRYAVERKAMEEALFEQRERAQVTLNCIGDAVASSDSLGNITFLNRGAEEMTGWPMSEALGRPMEEVLDIQDADSHAPVANPMQRAILLNQSGQLRLNCVLVRRDGFETHVEDSVAPIHDRDGLTTGAVIVLRDVGPAREMARLMAHSAQHDFLTGLPNRMLLNDRVEHAVSIAPRHAKKVAVLFLDLDGFKHINDSLGHPIGDKLLQSVGRRLVDCVRGSDTVSRQGGDEFVVLLSEIEHAEDAALTARRMLDSIAEAHMIDQHELHVTTSIGVSIFPDDGADAETLIKNADTAMYQAKDAGRQGFQFFRPVMNVRAVERQSIEEGLRRALDRREFALHYQPMVDIKTSRIIGTEALLRWTHPGRGSMSPSVFVPVAEDTGLIVAIGDWVLREACRQARTWSDAGLPAMTMSVNISAPEFRHKGFVDRIFTTLDETGLDASRLELEITENVLMKRTDYSASVLRTLRDKGIRIAIDDFGTGYSSLGYLQRFPVDALKIDHSFVRQISSPADNTTIVSAVIGMARNLRLRVVAEGVETLEEFSFLQDQSCDEAQGFYFSKPLRAEKLTVLLQACAEDIAAPGAVPARELRR